MLMKEVFLYYIYSEGGGGGGGGEGGGGKKQSGNFEELIESITNIGCVTFFINQNRLFRL